METPGDGAAPRDPEEVEATATATTTELPADTRLGPVQLSVADLERSIAYYGEAIGLHPVSNGSQAITLGAGDRPLLELVEQPGAAPSDGYTGLYHLALLVPERRDLAAWLAHAARDNVSLTGLSDHYVSEAIYLRDPDRHGIEIYCDRPRSIWEGQVGQRMTTQPLDVEGLLAELDDPSSTPFHGLAFGTVMGHVHLKVADIPATVAFYRDLVGFGLMAQLGGQAAFLAAGGYHHHLGANTWESAGAQPPPAGLAALQHYTVVLPGQPARDALAARLEQAVAPVAQGSDGPIVTDPSGNRLLLAAG
jgi:catechol 2,3-dioxygenase